MSVLRLELVVEEAISSVKQLSNSKVMERNISNLTHQEIEEKIRELEHMYGELFGSNRSMVDLHSVHQKILELRQELHKRNNI